jgi:NADPH:quinone reductase-like Zn-dependent oxidoreductase
VFGGCSHAFAEYAIENQDKFAKKPSNLDFEQAAALPTAALTALQALRDHGKVQEGQEVLINGASGGVGTFSVQVAKALGAEVTGVCSTKKVEMVRSLGADHVIDYTREDFTKGDRRYDLILDNVASRAFFDLKRVLKPNGLILPNSGHGGMSYVFKAFLLSAFSRRHGRPFMAVPNHTDLTVLKELCESGKVKPVIDKTYPLSETPKALGYLDQEHARGKVVIIMKQ